MTSKSSGKIDGLDSLRGVAALVVLLHHAFGMVELPQYFNARLVWGVFEEGKLGVTIFFVLSGFVISWSNPNDCQSGRALLIYLIRRFVRIFPMYWVTCLLMLPVYWKFAPSSLGEISVVRTVHDMFLLPYKFSPMLRAAWTLVFELLFYVLFIPMLVRRRWGGAFWAVIAATILGFEFAEYHFANPWLNHMFSLYVLQFILGMVLSEIIQKRCFPARFAKLSIWGGGVAILITAIVEHITGMKFLPEHLHHALFTALIIFGVVTQPDVSGVHASWIGRGLRELGKCSYSVYLLHIPMLQIVLRGMVKMLGNEPGLFLIWVAALTSILFSLAFGLLMSRWVELPLLYWCKRGIHRLKREQSTLVNRSPISPV